MFLLVFNVFILLNSFHRTSTTINTSKKYIINPSSYTWSSIEVISDNTNGTINWNTDHSDSPVITVDTSSNIHVVWEDETNLEGCNTDYDIFYQEKSEDTGIWTYPKLVTTDSSSYSEQPTINTFTDESKGTTTRHVAWSESGSIYYKNSTSPTGWSSHTAEEKALGQDALLFG